MLLVLPSELYPTGLQEDEGTSKSNETDHPILGKKQKRKAA